MAREHPPARRRGARARKRCLARTGDGPLGRLALLACLLALSLAMPTLAAGAETGGASPSLTQPGAETGAGGTSTQQPVPVTVAIEPKQPGRPVARRFLGLSFEVAALAQLAQYAHRGDLVTLLRSLGPGVLRFGGITADENVAWTDAQTPRPTWASSTIDAADMRGIGALARASGWQVLLTVGMAHYEPQAAAREVAAAHKALGPYLAAVEIGNEPNSYGAHGFRTLPWIAQGYEEQVTAYREAIETLTPDVPIAGPDVSGSGAFPEWGEEEALSQQPALLTGHHYPLGCAQTPPPSIEMLLSPAIRAAEAHSLATYMAVSLRNRIPLRIDETNTVSCGGVAGISNTFASALWASAYATQAMADGVVGINLQGNPTNCPGYTPVCAPTATALTGGALRAEPDWYALLLTSSLIGTRPLPATISAASTPNLVAAPFSGPGNSMQVVLVDDEPPGSRPLSVRMNVSAGMSEAHELLLTAASPAATGGVLLGGRAVAADGSWHAARSLPRLAVHAGVLGVELQPSSAALLTVTPAKPAHKPPKRKRAARKQG